MLFLRRCALRAYSTATSAGNVWRESSLRPADEIYATDYRQRRNELVGLISKLSPDVSHTIIVPGLSMSYSAPDVPHLFRQRANFRYLTGITEPNACLMISVKNPGCHVKSTIFYEQTNEEIRIWEGNRLDAESAVSISDADCSYPINQFSTILIQHMTPQDNTVKRQLWIDDYNLAESGVPPVPLQLRSVSSSFSFAASFGPYQSISPYIHRLRSVKSPKELTLIRYACLSAANSMAEAVRQSSNLATEFAIESIFESSIKMRYGCRRLSFPCVVASGENATALHYLTNEKKLKSGDTVLMDSGCEYSGYCSDMTRVWPIGGTFSPAARSLYELLLSVHNQCVNQVKPSVPLESIYSKMLDLIGREAKELGVIKKSSPVYDLPFSAIGRRLCPHHVSHHLGLDVHDCYLVSRSEPLAPNNVVTVEPGIYIRPEWTKDYHHEFCGIGMRLEDDVVVQRDSNKPAEVLTSAFPMSIKFVEDLASGQL